ncbi:MAG: peroxiredoxin [Zetaproteobacteria bacterium CG06_land_8_20_14_3_00_59_53]|nr:MAG: peroxiredoxin [Zetaproteobacteria bacterium CG2_30_59_37]PIO88729.1 MAG: peroxiredoxin [Zetaproteobacteria bacterium CG23_combo_of_CG06-09_8_20_14_all_59_86]PIQ65403.1 MAG: peroxiredoxin [Zetaproteobacteria bacterium CG11_big_fil_rev_8_21_14_0_20_59_439]PIU69655.1 MAG: peroxiredoxin [Zetaproteobacteria bacterium CG06_land_8_20_14_3_00_59_53]PIU96902.1 MAG: peroxiredoxin [Zetaproteobacteria bacterium CG03_land_8_20_14_0_80_59_51]PIY47570.1 MAG: peroxiredoxin [Zetaproteobacteria bacteriu
MSYSINPGDSAPDIELPVWPLGQMKLSDLRGRWVVLYFYPKDSTSGCTTESCGFRDAEADFSGVDASIVGVSRDSVASHRKFYEAQSLNFPLISDGDEMLCRAFDVIQKKMNYGKEYLGVERSTFLIGPDGVIREAWRKVKVDGHVDAVLARLKELRG